MEAEKKAREHRELVTRLQSVCFTSPAKREHTFENATMLPTDILEKAKRFVEDWPTVRRENTGQLYWGDCGTGKSYTAACIANALMEQEIPVLMRNLGDFTGGSFEDKEELCRDVARYGLVIFDDLGMERASFVHEHPHYSRYYEGVYILLNTGLRVSEFCGLTMADIDFKEHCIHVTGQLLRHSNMVLEFETPKTDAGTRDIPMTPEVEHCFRNLIKKRERMTVEPIVGGKAGFLYLDKYKRPVVALHWEHYFRGMISAYNRSHSISLPNFTPHNCRHTFSTKMSRMGMYPKNLQYIMGHSDYKVTMNTYTHLAFEDARRELKRVNDQGMIG